MPIPGDDDDYADDDTDLLDDEGTGAESEDAAGSDPGGGDDEGDLSAERADALSEEDDGASGTRETAVPRGQQAPRTEEPLTRGQRQIIRLRRERQEAQRRVEALERERSEWMRSQTQARQAETLQQREARLAMLSPEERNAEEWREWQQGVNQQVQQLRSQGANELDKLQYEAKAARYSHYAKWSDKVEQEWENRARQGVFVKREVILKYLIGDQADRDMQRGSVSRKAKLEGRRRIEAAQTRPGSGKGDASTTRGKRGETAEDRLRGQNI